jgi:hypothetical protein
VSRLLGPPCCQELIHRSRREEEGEPRIERAAVGRGPPPKGRDETRGGGEPQPAPTATDKGILIVGLEP